MESKIELGHWTKKLGRPLTFMREIEFAQEVGAVWKVKSNGLQRDVILDQIPGWLPPMWGSDADWLYIRRPEGIWKTRLPLDKELGIPTHLYISDGGIGNSAPLGGECVGDHIVSMGGWHCWDSVEVSLDAIDIDSETKNSALEREIDADEFGGYLSDIKRCDPTMLLIDGGCAFDREPAFSRSGSWLHATDRFTGRTVAYAMTDCEQAEMALARGYLWLYFGSLWMKPFRVKVTLPNA